MPTEYHLLDSVSAQRLDSFMAFLAAGPWQRLISSLLYRLVVIGSLFNGQRYSRSVMGITKNPFRCDIEGFSSAAERYASYLP